MYSHQDDEDDGDDEEYIFFRFYIEIHIRFILVHPQVKEREKTGRTFATTAIKFTSLSLFLYSSLQ
jgi:hypothetical protein